MPEDDIYHSKRKYENFVKNVKLFLIPPEKKKSGYVRGKAKYYCKYKGNLKYFYKLFDRFGAEDLSYIRRGRLLCIFRLICYVAGKDLANSSYTLLMRQKPAVIKDVDEVFNLSKVEKHALLTASVGEGLLLIEDEHSEIKVVASKEEHRLITTNPDEIIEQKKSKAKKSKIANKVKPKNLLGKASPKIKVEIKVDAEKGFYRHKDLSLPEIKYLLAKKYKISMQKSCFSNKKERYLLKPRFNEGVNHFFLIQDISNYLRSKNLEVKIFETKKPDIIFTIDKKKVAIEIETGKVLKNNKKQFLEKIKLLKKDFGENWFFILTDKNLSKDYNKFGKVVDKRYLNNYFEKILKISPKGKSS